MLSSLPSWTILGSPVRARQLPNGRTPQTLADPGTVWHPVPPKREAEHVVRFQLVIDCADPDRLARFWAAALHYEFEPAPDAFDSWDDHYRDLGVGEEDLGIGEDSIVDPHGDGPRIWFQRVPDRKTVKNRLHLDISAGGDRSVRSRPAPRVSTPRCSGLSASARR